VVDRLPPARFAGQVLPRDGGHLPPDACHLALQVLILVALAGTGFATISLWRSRLAGTGS
jgi:hypothetical protein